MTHQAKTQKISYIPLKDHERKVINFNIVLSHPAFFLLPFPLCLLEDLFCGD